MSQLTQAEIRKLVERYPYLLPRNVFTDELPDDYDYTYIKYLEIPKGWNRIFLQMCEDIRQPLIDDDYLDKFRFTQVKEKFNRLECYNTGAPEKVHKIILKYSVLASYVCTRCGNPAFYEIQEGYIESMCIDCWKDYGRHKHVKRIKPKIYFTLITQKGKRKYEEFLFIDEEWGRYENSIKDLYNGLIDL